jgi:uncharacterized membrane-anchored protein YitT (DUF2179 family)
MLFNVIGGAILAFGLYQIHSISDVTEGGVLGLTLLFQHWLGISPSITGLVLNAACYLFGYKTLGKQFIRNSIVAGSCFSLFYALFEQTPRLWPQISEYPLIAAVIGAVFVGIGVGLCVRNNGAPTGDDALAMGLSHILKTKIQWIYLASDMTVLLLSLSYIPLRRILYSLLTVVLSGQIIGLTATVKRPHQNTPQKHE